MAGENVEETEISGPPDDEPVARAEIDELRAHVDDQREEFTELLEDVRERVVQVKREADRKAPADHDHGRYATRDDLDDLREGLDAVAADLEDLEATVNAGFDNFESVVEDLLDETDRVADRLDALGRATLDLREARVARAERDRERAAADALKLAANRLGVERADCEDCEATVTIGLLTRPACPHCGADFADVRRGRWLVGSHTLVTGETPALDGTVAEPLPTPRVDLLDASAADPTDDPPGAEASGDGGADT